VRLADVEALRTLGVPETLAPLEGMSTVLVGAGLFTVTEIGMLVSVSLSASVAKLTWL
jgi:hypothetical protein